MREAHSKDAPIYGEVDDPVYGEVDSPVAVETPHVASAPVATPTHTEAPIDIHQAHKQPCLLTRARVELVWTFSMKRQESSPK